MENKAPLSGWWRIGVMGRGRARKGVALCWPPAGLQATPNTITGVGRRAEEPGQERVLSGGCSSGQGRGAWRSRLCWGRENRPSHPPLLSREGQGGRNVHPAACLLYVLPSGNSSIPGPRQGQGLPPRPCRRGQSLQVALREGGAQSKQEIWGGWR